MASLGLVGGCTAEPPEPVDPSVAVPEVTSTPSPTPTPTTPPEAVKPVAPEAMSQRGTEGAAAAAEYFLSLYPYVYATGDLTSMKSMIDPECIFCADVVADVTADVAAGLTTVGGTVRVDATRSTQISDEFYSVDLTVETDPSQAIDGTGGVVESFAAGSGTAVMIVLGAPGRWIIRAVELTRTGTGS